MKSKVLKRIMCVIMCLIVCGSTTAVALYTESPVTEIATPWYVNIASKSCSLNISGVNSTSSATLRTSSSMSLSIKMELQKKKSGTYTTIETWNSSRTGSVLTMSEDRLINVLSEYRLKVTFSAGTETVVAYAYP